MNAVIALAKCESSEKMYGIRFEQSKENWIFTWAFPVNEASASRERYDETKITGPLVKGEEFPGCPHCDNEGFWLCSGCGKLNCWDCNTKHVTCSWCGSSGELGGRIDSIDTVQGF